MGNCQASEAATVVIQHPGGRVERLYWPTPAGEVMQSHPGHYVAVCLPGQQRRRAEHHQGGGGGGTRVRLLRSKDTLLLGQVYRLVTSQEVMNGLRARKQEKMRAAQMDLLTNHSLQQQQRQQQQTTKTVAADEVKLMSSSAQTSIKSCLVSLIISLAFLAHNTQTLCWVMVNSPPFLCSHGGEDDSGEPISCPGERSSEGSTICSSPATALATVAAEHIGTRQLIMAGEAGRRLGSP